MRLCLLSFILCLPLSVFGQQVTIAPYYGGRQAAISLTFDDGLLDQYTLAFPQLKSRGLKATFAIIGSKVGGIIRSKQDRIDHTDGTPVITLHTSLSPSLFVHPLTLMLPSRPVRQVEQGGKPLSVYVRGGHQLVDVNLHDGPIRITCNQNIQ